MCALLELFLFPLKILCVIRALVDGAVGSILGAHI